MYSWRFTALIAVPRLTGKLRHLGFGHARELRVERVAGVAELEEPLDVPLLDVGFGSVDVDPDIDRVRQTEEVEPFHDDGIGLCEYLLLVEHVVRLVRVHGHADVCVHRP